MSVTEILQQIDALPQDERHQLIQKLVGARSNQPRSASLSEKVSDKIDRMRAGHAVDLDDALALHEKLLKLGL
jgi:hypothetical protein